MDSDLGLTGKRYWKYRLRLDMRLLNHTNDRSSLFSAFPGLASLLGATVKHHVVHRCGVFGADDCRPADAVHFASQDVRLEFLSAGETNGEETLCEGGGSRDGDVSF